MNDVRTRDIWTKSHARIRGTSHRLDHLLYEMRITLCLGSKWANKFFPS